MAYISVGFSDGLNEKGLVVANLMFPGYAQYESFDPGKANITLAHFELATWVLSNFAKQFGQGSGMIGLPGDFTPQELALY